VKKYPELKSSDVLERAHSDDSRLKKSIGRLFLPPTFEGICQRLKKMLMNQWHSAQKQMRRPATAGRRMDRELT